MKKQSSAVTGRVMLNAMTFIVCPTVICSDLYSILGTVVTSTVTSGDIQCTVMTGDIQGTVICGDIHGTVISGDIQDTVIYTR